MAVSSSNIIVGAPDRVTGAIMVAPLGTALPTTVSTAPNVAFKDLGYISEDGVSVSQSSTWETIRDWGGDQVRKFMTEFTGTMQFTLLETNDAGLKFAYGDDNVTVTPATSTTGLLTATKWNSTEPPSRALIVNIKDGVRKVRLVGPLAQVTERGDISYSRNAAVMHQLTVEFYPDAAGNSLYTYTDNGVFTA